MSLGRRIQYSEALDLAGRAVERLRLVVARVEIAGSLRREQETVGDIELVAEPVSNGDLFGPSPSPQIEPVQAAMKDMGRWVKGGRRMMQVTDVLGHRDVKLELYLVHPPAQWGSLLAIRTGPADLGQYCMTAMRPRGYRHHHGHAVRIDTGELVPTPEATLLAAFYVGTRQQPVGGSGTPRVETVAPAAVAATAWVCWMLALLG